MSTVYVCKETAFTSSDIFFSLKSLMLTGWLFCIWEQNEIFQLTDLSCKAAWGPGPSAANFRVWPGPGQPGKGEDLQGSLCSLHSASLGRSSLQCPARPSGGWSCACPPPASYTAQSLKSWPWLSHERWASRWGCCGASGPCGLLQTPTYPLRQSQQSL